MARQIPSWLRETLRVWTQYFAVALCAFPAGIVHFLLTQRGVNHTASLVISSGLCLILAAVMWRLCAKRFLLPQTATVSYLVSSTSTYIPPIYAPNVGLISGISFAIAIACNPSPPTISHPNSLAISNTAVAKITQIEQV